MQYYLTMKMVMNGMNLFVGQYGGHYQSIHPLNTPPSEQVEQPVESFSDDIALSNLDVEIGNSASMILPPMENQVIIMLELPSLKLFISYYL